MSSSRITGKKSRSKTAPSGRSSSSSKAGLIFPVGRTFNRMKKTKMMPRISRKAAIALAASLQYLLEEVLEVAVGVTAQRKQKQIKPSAINVSIKEDAEMSKFVGRLIIRQGGVIPHIHASLLPKNSKAAKTAVVKGETA